MPVPKKRGRGRPPSGEVPGVLYAWRSTIARLRRVAVIRRKPMAAVLSDLVTQALEEHGGLDSADANVG